MDAPAISIQSKDAFQAVFQHPGLFGFALPYDIDLPGKILKGLHDLFVSFYISFEFFHPECFFAFRHSGF